MRLLSERLHLEPFDNELRREQPAERFFILRELFGD